MNTLYFRAEYLTLEQIGLFTLVTAHAMTVSPFSSLGTSSTYIKFFPSLKDADRNRLFSFLFLVAVIGNAAFLLVGFLLKDIIIVRYIERAPEYIDFISITGIIVLSNSLFELFFSFSRSVMKVIFPSFLRDIYLRVGTLSLIIGFAFDWWSFSTAVFGLGFVYVGAFALLFAQLVLFHHFRFDFRFSIFKGPYTIKLFKFAGYAMLVAGSFALYNNASYDQITAFLGSDATGIFQTCFFIAVIVEMPRRNMSKVMSPIISKESQAQNLKEIESLYHRGSLTMGVLGLLLFIGIMTNLTDLFAFIPKGKEFQAGYWIVIIICISKVSVMLSSFSSEIINFSHLYRFNLFFQVAATVALIGLNYLLIPIWGINGAGIAYLSATLINILLKFFFVGIHFKIYPITKAHVPLFLIAALVAVLAFWFQTNLHPIISIGIRSVLTAMLFLGLVYYFRVSEDINKLIRSTFDQLFKIKLS